MKKLAVMLVVAGLLLPVAGLGAQGEEDCLLDASRSLKDSDLSGADWFAAVDEARSACMETAAAPSPTPTPDRGPAGQPLVEADRFNVTTNSNINLRAGPGTDYDVAGQTRPGEVMRVTATGEDEQGRLWYLVDGAHWLAGWLTRRAPDEILSPGEILYQGPHPDCFLIITTLRDSRRWLTISISGENRDGVTFDVTLPGSDSPLPVWRQRLNNFIDTGDVYVAQEYRNIWWPTGLYTFTFTYDGVTKVYGWEIGDGRQDIGAYCEDGAASMVPTPSL